MMKTLAKCIKWELIFYFQFLKWILLGVSISLFAVLIEPLISSQIYSQITTIISNMLLVVSFLAIIFPMIGTAIDLGGKANTLDRIKNIPFFSLVANKFFIQLVFWVISILIIFIADDFGEFFYNFNFLGITGIWRLILFSLSINSLIISVVINYSVIYTNKLGIAYRILDIIFFAIIGSIFFLRATVSWDIFWGEGDIVEELRFIDTAWVWGQNFMGSNIINNAPVILTVLVIIYYIIAFGSLFLSKHLYENKFEAINVWE